MRMNVLDILSLLFFYVKQPQLCNVTSEMRRHPVQLGEIVHEVVRVGADPAGHLPLLLHAQVSKPVGRGGGRIAGENVMLLALVCYVPEDKVSVCDSPGGVEQLSLPLPNRPVGFRVQTCRGRERNKPWSTQSHIVIITEGVVFLQLTGDVLHALREHVGHHLQPAEGLLGAGQQVAEGAVQRGEPGDVALLPAGDDPPAGGGVGDPGPDPPDAVDVLPDLEVPPPDELLSALGLPGLRLVREHDQVLVRVRHQEGQVGAVHRELAGEHLHRPHVP